MNNRHITANPTSIDDAPALTPNMLLTFQRRPAFPPGSFDVKAHTQAVVEASAASGQRFLEALDRRISANTTT